jgi:hypothetical protein
LRKFGDGDAGPLKTKGFLEVDFAGLASQARFTRFLQIRPA